MEAAQGARSSRRSQRGERLRWIHTMSSQRGHSSLLSLEAGENEWAALARCRGAGAALITLRRGRGRQRFTGKTQRAVDLTELAEGISLGGAGLERRPSATAWRSSGAHARAGVRRASSGSCGKSAGGARGGTWRGRGRQPQVRGDRAQDEVNDGRRWLPMRGSRGP